MLGAVIESMTASEKDRIFHFQNPESVFVSRKAELIKLTAALKAARAGLPRVFPASVAVGKTKRTTEFPVLADGYCAKVRVLKADSVSRDPGSYGRLIPVMDARKSEPGREKSDTAGSDLRPVFPVPQLVGTANRRSGVQPHRARIEIGVRMRIDEARPRPLLTMGEHERDWVPGRAKKSSAGVQP
jgi:hypothetical protein